MREMVKSKSWRTREGAAVWKKEKKNWREIAGELLVCRFVVLLFRCFREEEEDEELNC